MSLEPPLKISGLAKAAFPQGVFGFLFTFELALDTSKADAGSP